jgi:hypothetical protein
MEYSKYTKEAFEKAGINSHQARLLADELQEDVLKELHQEIEGAFIKIVSRLNSQGHDLSPCGRLTPGDYEFRGKEENGNCGLRLACDVVISAGYSHIVRIERET